MLFCHLNAININKKQDNLLKNRPVATTSKESTFLCSSFSIPYNDSLKIKKSKSRRSYEKSNTHGKYYWHWTTV